MSISASLGWYLRRSSDVASLAAFYTDALGLVHLRSGPTIAMLWAGETVVFEINSDGPGDWPADQPDTAVPIFRVHDLDSLVDRLEAAGAPEIDRVRENAGETAYLRDPDGGIFGLRTRRRGTDTEAWRRWDAGETTIPGVDPLPNGIQHLGWIQRPVADLAAMRIFYRDALGLPEVDAGRESVALDLGDCSSLELIPGGTPEPIPADREDIRSTFVVRTANLATALTRLASAAVPLVGTPITFPSGSRIAYAADPEGHLFGIQERTTTLGTAEDLEAARRLDTN